MRNFKKQFRGFSLMEILIVMGVLVFISVVVANFQTNVINFNISTQNSLTAQTDGRRVVKTIVAELRNVSPSALGSYPIEAAGTSTLIFYSDADKDGQRERIRYFLNNRTLQKGVIKPSGNPVGYTGAETVTTLVSDLANNPGPIFEYYDTSYSGTSLPLTQPVNILNVRLVKITVYIDKDPNRSPATIIFTSQVTLRNLKDNL